MSSLVIRGDTSGEITLTSPAVAGTNTLTLPALTGTVLVQGEASATVSRTAVATTSGTSADALTIPSWVKKITVMLSGVSTNGTSDLQIQLGDSGGVETTGYVSACGAPSTALAASSSTAGLILTTNTTAADTWQGSVVISLLGSNTWTAIGSITNGATVRSSAGSKTLSATLDRIRLTTVNGTDAFDAGSVSIMYE